jgi:hypothetical protein
MSAASLFIWHVIRSDIANQFKVLLLSMSSCAFLYFYESCSIDWLQWNRNKTLFVY